MAEGIEATKAEVWGVDGGCGAGALTLGSTLAECGDGPDS